MRLQSQGLEGLQAGLRAARDAGRVGLGDVVRSGTKTVGAEVLRASGSSGRVAEGITVKVTGSGLETEGKVALTGAAIPYATGAEPHEIEPRRKALRFGGRFASRVKHPGTRPNDFFERGVKRAVPQIEADLDRLGSEVLETIADEIDSDRSPR